MNSGKILNLFVFILLVFFFITPLKAEKINVAIVDSGVDFEHKDLAKKSFTNFAEKINGLDDDANGFIDDIKGWNPLKDNNELFDKKFVEQFKPGYLWALRALFLISKIEMKEELTALEKLELQFYIKNLSFLFELDMNIFSTIMHGTHCAGITAKDNDKINLLGVKMIGGGMANRKNETNPSDEVIANPSASEIESFLSQMLEEQRNFLSEITRFLKTQKIKVVNASWGVNEQMVQNILKSKFQGLSEKTYRKIAKSYLVKAEKAYSIIAEELPESLWSIAAGNDGTDNDVIIDYPANLRFPNTISVAAVDKDGLLASFSNYGVKNVDVAAPGVAIESTVPMNEYARMSGTSMAAPYVTKVASLVFAENPLLKPEQVKRILMETVDKKDYLKDKIKTSGIVNLNRAVEAGRASLNNELDNAIKIAFAKVPTLKFKNGTSHSTGRGKSITEKMVGYSDKEKEMVKEIYKKILEMPRGF